MEKRRALLWAAYGVMAVVFAQYVVKVFLKGGFGWVMRSSVFKGDALHNTSDIFQVLAVVFGIWLSFRPANREYQLGWRSLDALGSLMIGISLLYATVVSVLVPSLIGLASLVPWIGARLPASVETGSRLLDGWNGAFAVAIMLVSAGVSAVVGRYQVRVGRETGHASVVADGEETLSDGKVEALAAAGLVLQAGFHALSSVAVIGGLMGYLAVGIEDLLGLGMAYIMYGTAKEILANARDMILNRSLGDEIEQKIREVVLATCGVEGIGSFVTYRRWTCFVAEIDVETRLGSSGSNLVRHALTERILALLKEGDQEAHVSVRCVPPPIVETRRAFLVRIENGIPRVVGSPALATHLCVCDESDDGMPPKRHDVSVTPATLLSVLVAKNVQALCVYVASDHTLGDIRVLVGERVRVEPVPTSLPALLGIPLV